MNGASEHGFLLIDAIVTTAVVVIALASAGTFFLGNLTPAVASATLDVEAALDETRETAMAMDTATVVFTAGRAGHGFTARVYERTPGDPSFRARNGPVHASRTASVSETVAPLGVPGFALSMDRRGSVTGYTRFNPSDTTFARVACPSSNAFRLTIDDRRETRAVTVPCALALSTTAALAVATPQAAIVPVPQVAGTCPATSPCTPAPLVPGSATCPSDYTPDTTTLGRCASAACPPGFNGVPPVCIADVNPTPTPKPSTLPLYRVSIQGCGTVETSRIDSVSNVQRDADGNLFFSYDDAYGMSQTHICSAREP